MALTKVTANMVNPESASKTGVETLTNKTLDNTTTLTIKDANLTIQDDLDVTKQVKLQVSSLTTATTRTLTVPDANTTIVGTDVVQTLTNKTLTSPAITAPTGIVKGDVGLGLVDNTSDATKNAATATLTNKTLTSPVINTPTGIVKADVGLANVDNTSDATKNTAVTTLTNKTLTSPIINTPDIDGGVASNTARITLPKGTKAALDALTRKAGTKVFGTDTLVEYFDNGTALVAPLANPMTTSGDIIYGGAGGAPTRLPAGTADQYLKSSGAGAPSWAAFNSPVVAVIFKSTAQSIANATYTTVANYTTATVDTNTGFNLATGSYVVPVAGYYLVTAILSFASNATGLRHNTILKNGVIYQYGALEGAASGDGNIVSITAIISCVATDTIAQQAYQTSGAALDVRALGTATAMHIMKIA